MGRANSSSEWTKERVISELKRKKEELGKSPAKRDVSNSLAYAAKKRFDSWNDAKRAANLETFEFPGGRSWSKGKIIERLRKLASELGKSPVTEDDKSLAAVAHRYFGCWNEAKKAAGLEVFEEDRRKGMRWSRERVIQELQDLAGEVGRTPKVDDDPNLTQAARRHFESWNRALRVAEVDSLEPGENSIPVALNKLENRKEVLEETIEKVKCVLPPDSIDSIEEGAIDFLRSIKSFQGRSLQKLVLGCIYLSCRSNRVAVFPDELAEEALGREEGGGAVRKAAKVVRQKTEAPSPEPFEVGEIVGKFARTAGFGEKALESAVELAEKSTDKLNLSGRPRRSLAAAILYIVGCLHPDCNKLTRVEAGNVCGVSGASIGNNLRVLCEVLNRGNLPFVPHPPVRRYSSTVREAFVEAGDVERSILHKIRKLADELGRPPYMKDDEYLAQAARERFGSWNWAKREAGLEVFRGRPKTKKVDESPEIDEGKPKGLLTFVKRNADVYEHRLSGEKVKRTLGDIAEDLLVSWAKRHKDEVVGDFIRDENWCRVSYGVPDEHDRCEPRYGVNLEDIRCDLLFLIDQPSTGRSFVRV